MKNADEISKIELCECMTVAEYVDNVKRKLLIPYDGFGYYHDGENETKEMVSFDYEDVLKYVEKYPYVCWYNN